MLTSSLSLRAQAAPRKISSADAARCHEIFQTIYKDMRTSYYDPTFHGIDLDRTYHEYDARIDTAVSNGDAFRVIASFLDSFHDSHLFFDPPIRAASYQVDYRMEMIGSHCFVTQVRPGTDAATKMHVGDEILTLNSYNVNRGDIWQLEYFLHTLSPAAQERFDLLSPEGEKRTVAITHAVRSGKLLMDLTGSDFWELVRREESAEDLIQERYVEHGDVMVWKMAEFNADLSTIESLYDKARKHAALIIDLRGNPGGYIDTLQFAVGSLFDHDVKIADRVGRKPLKPQVGKTLHKPFTGKLIVLIDSGSASSSELFARAVQLEHRGTVVGDTSAGAVMEAHHFSDSLGVDSKIFYGVSVTDANLIMADGKSLEHTGVVPDEEVVPTAGDLAAGRDPVMAKAFQLAGSSVPEGISGKLFPYLGRSSNASGDCPFKR